MLFWFLGWGNQADKIQEEPPRKQTRRNLSVSLAQSSGNISQTRVCDEGVVPLQCTAEPAQTTVWAPPLSSSTVCDPNMTFEIPDNDDQTAANATIIINTSSPCQASHSTHLSDLQQPPRTNGVNQSPTKG